MRAPKRYDIESGILGWKEGDQRIFRLWLGGCRLNLQIEDSLV